MLIIVCLMILSILTIMGTTSTHTSMEEMWMMRNVASRTIDFHAAEAAAMQALQILEMLRAGDPDHLRMLRREIPIALPNNPVSLATKVWLILHGPLTEPLKWDTDFTSAVDVNTDPWSPARYTAIHTGPAPGGSIALGGTNLHELSIISRFRIGSDMNGDGVLDTAGNEYVGDYSIELGYRKRF